MICIYHEIDLDGWCSAAIVKKVYPDAKLIGWNYGKPIPDITDEDIVMVDVSFSPSEMAGLAKNNRSLVWIDHHKSAIESHRKWAETNPVLFKPCYRIGVGACELVWEYYFPNESIPKIVELLGKYDSWRKDEEWDSLVIPFQYGMKSIVSSVETFPSLLLDSRRNMGDSEMVSILQRGKILFEGNQQNNRFLQKQMGYEGKFAGHNAVFMNVKGSSQSFDGFYDPNNHDLMVAFFFNGKAWHVSLYATKDNVDCSQIAKQYGGGGHKGASGFQTTDFNIFKQEET